MRRQRTSTGPIRLLAAGLGLLVISALAGCSPKDYRVDADRAAYAIIKEAQKRTLGEAETFTIEPAADTLRRKLLLGQELPRSGPASLGTDQLQPIPHWPEKSEPQAETTPPWSADEPLTLSLAEALGVAARNSRDFQTRKETIFREALALDLEANQFRSLLFAGAEANYEADLSGASAVHGLAGSATSSLQRQFKNGTLLTAGFAVDLVKLLTQDKSSALGLLADMTITIPLLRGSGEHIVTEPLKQAEREVAYALWDFERFRRTLAVQVAGEYLEALRQSDQITNAAENYKRLIAATRRSRSLAKAGRLSPIQVDQALQDELRARDRWITAQQEYHRRLDALKITLGLPADAKIDLDRGELDTLRKATDRFAASRPADDGEQPAADAPIELEPPDTRSGGPMEIDEAKATGLALRNRMDLRTALGRVYDAQRKVVVAADGLKMGLTLSGSASLGERRTVAAASAGNAKLDFATGSYSLGLALDLPLERTAERNAYRESFIALEQAVRDVQALEDDIKQAIRQALRQLLQTRESYLIQTQAVTVAQRRVTSTEQFLQAGRAEIRDVLEAQEALLTAQNARTAALVNYRIAELQLQRDMGVLQVTMKGNWHEYEPDKPAEK